MYNTFKDVSRHLAVRENTKADRTLFSQNSFDELSVVGLSYSLDHILQ